MNNIPKIYTTLSNGLKVEYTVVLTFTLNNNNYAVYTDNTYDKNKKIRLFVAKYNPTLKNPFLGEPTTNEEWNEITKIINSVIIPK